MTREDPDERHPHWRTREVRAALDEGRRWANAAPQSQSAQGNWQAHAVLDIVEAALTAGAGVASLHGTICECGLAKSYHPRPDHEYRPRYRNADAEWAALALKLDTPTITHVDVLFAIDTHRPLIEAALAASPADAGIDMPKCILLHDHNHDEGHCVYTEHCSGCSGWVSTSTHDEGYECPGV